MKLFQTKHEVIGERPVPRHIAIVMDGNGRWATKRGLPRTAGHSVGSETFRKIATYCKEIGVEYLTVYAFSTENWKRSEEEVGAIMGLLKKYLFGGAVGAVLGTVAAQLIPNELLSKLFSLFLLAFGLRELISAGKREPAQKTRKAP